MIFTDDVVLDILNGIRSTEYRTISFTIKDDARKLVEATLCEFRQIFESGGILYEITGIVNFHPYYGFKYRDYKLRRLV